MNFSLDHNCKIKKPEDLRVQLTLFQPGGRLCPQHYCLPPPPQIWKLIYTSDKLNTYLVTYMSRSLEVHNSAEIFLKLIWFITTGYLSITSLNINMFHLFLFFEVYYKWLTLFLLLPIKINNKWEISRI